MLGLSRTVIMTAVRVRGKCSQRRVGIDSPPRDIMVANNTRTRRAGNAETLIKRYGVAWKDVQDIELQVEDWKGRSEAWRNWARQDQADALLAA
jgi:hypothetical protein